MSLITRTSGEHQGNAECLCKHRGNAEEYPDGLPEDFTPDPLVPKKEERKMRIQDVSLNQLAFIIEQLITQNKALENRVEALERERDNG